MSQIIKGVSFDGKEVFIKVNADGELVLSPLPSGNNNIGDVDVVTTTGLKASELNLDADKDLQTDIKTMPSLPSGTNDIGQVLNGFQEVEVLPSLARTTSGDTGATPVDCSKYKEATVFIDVTAASGTTPTLDVKFQTQDPVSLKWFDLSELTFTQVTATTSEMKVKSGLLGSKLRCIYTLGGTTPSFTFSVGMILKS